MRFEFTGKAQEIIAKLFSFVEQWHRDNDGEEPLFDIKLHKPKRSNTQNAYYWELLSKLARTLGYANDEVHRHMVMNYGVCEVMLVDVNVPLAQYFDYFDIVSTGYLNGRQYNHVRVFKGSSKMDSTEFSHLLHGLIQECQQQGIDTRTPAEIAAMEYAEAVA